MMSYITAAPQASFTGAPPEEGKALLLNVHKGVWGHHASSRSTVKKAFRQGFYWLTATSDVAQIVRSYKGCQY
jgi:hypothetical protein